MQQVLASFLVDLPAAVFITMHMFNRANSTLAEILNRAGTPTAKYAADGDLIEHGCIYVAPPDYHLVLHPGKIELQHGPQENLQRPCINVMFRSAAIAYRERVVGVVHTRTPGRRRCGIVGDIAKRRKPLEKEKPQDPLAAKALDTEINRRRNEAGVLKGSEERAN